MASGDTLLILTALASTPPDADAATLDVVAGGSTPAEQVPVLDFDPGATQEYADFICEMPQSYGGGGLTIIIKWSSDATSGDCVWDIAIRRVQDDAEDIDGAHTYAYNSVTSTTASAAGELDYATITFTDGADMDSVAVGESFVLRLSRDSDEAADTMDSNDAEFWSMEIKET